MFVYDWFKNIFYNLGLWKKNAKIVFLGLDNAGKSTLLTILKKGVVEQIDPTKHAHQEKITIGNVVMSAFDLGGHQAMRKIWKDYFLKIDGIVYLIDSSRPDRFEESKKEFDKVIQANELGNIPILILGNKIDKDSAVNEDEIK